MAANLAGLRAEIQKRGRRRGISAYTDDLRRRATDAVLELRSQGASWRRIEELLGVSGETARRWCLARGGASDASARAEDPPSVALVPVRVVATTVSETSPTLTLISPSGWRLVGLDIETAIRVLGQLS